MTMCYLEPAGEMADPETTIWTEHWWGKVTYGRIGRKIGAVGRRFAANGFSIASLTPDEGEYPFLPSRMALGDGLDQVSGRLEIEGVWGADVERKDLVSLPVDFVGEAGKVPDGGAQYRSSV